MVLTRILGMCALTLTLDIWPWVTFMIHPWVMDNKINAWNIIQIQNLAVRSLWPRHGFWVCVHIDLRDMNLGQGHHISLGRGQQLCEILSRSNTAVKRYDPEPIFGMCGQWPWPWRYGLGSRSWHTIEWSWTTIVWNIIQIQNGSEELWSGNGFWVWVWVCTQWPWRYDLGSRSWHTLESWITIVCNIQIQHGSYGPDTDFRHVYTVTLTSKRYHLESR